MLTIIRPYLYGALLIAIVSGGVYVHWLSDSRDKYKASSEQFQAEAKAANDVLVTERKAAADANARAKQTQIEKQVIENEAQANRDCIANKSCGVRVDLKYKACPVSSATTSGSGIDELQEQNRRNFELWINDLKESVKLDNLYIIKLQEDVKVRSDSKYCQLK